MMTSIPRRRVLTGLAALPLLGFRQTEPDLVLLHGRIWTGNSAQTEVEALAISGDRVLALGSDQEVLRLATTRTRKIDLGGKRVLPGLNDAHAHPGMAGVQHLTEVACDKVNKQNILAALHARAAEVPRGAWVVGFLYDDSRADAPLTRADLDAACPNNPVLVHHRGGHTAFINSLAFARAGITPKTPDPAGGHFDRDPNGHLTGRVADAALDPLLGLLPSTATREDYRNGTKLIGKIFASKGITSVCDADTSHEALRGYQDAYEGGELSCRLYCHIDEVDFDRLTEAGIRSGFGDDWLRIGAVKQYADGSILERTAWLSEPYVGMPGYTGLPQESRDELYVRSRRAWEAGWRLATHANGDLAIDRMLGIYEQLQREIPRSDPRFRLEHCTLVNDQLVKRMVAVGAVPIPFSGYVYFHSDILHYYGAERVRHMFAMRSFLDAGLRPPAASDYTASPIDPMLWFRSEITRADPQGKLWGPNQRISLAEAIRCATLHGAYASHEENDKGSLEPGKLADLVVLAEDLFSVDPTALTSIRAERTMVGGRWVYES